MVSLIAGERASAFDDSQARHERRDGRRRVPAADAGARESLVSAAAADIV